MLVCDRCTTVHVCTTVCDYCTTVHVCTTVYVCTTVHVCTTVCDYCTTVCTTVHVALFEPMSKKAPTAFTHALVCFKCHCVLHVRVCCEGRLCFWSGFGVENTMLFKFVHANAVVLPPESPPAKIIWCTHAHFNPLTHIPCLKHTVQLEPSCTIMRGKSRCGFPQCDQSP